MVLSDRVLCGALMVEAPFAWLRALAALRSFHWKDRECAFGVPTPSPSLLQIVPAAFVFARVAGGLGEVAGAGAQGCGGGGVEAVFAGELLPAGQAGGVEGACGDGGLNGAAGFAVVCAVSEAAGLGEGDEVGEGGLDPLGHVGKAQFPHAGGVDQPSAAGDFEQCAGGGGVAAFGVILADATSIEPEAGERIGEG